MKRRFVMIILIGIFLLIGFEVCNTEEELASIYSEAPILAERVAAGELSPVDERLPKNPVLIQPVEQVGVYGDTWRMGFTGTDNRTTIRVYAGYENLLRWDPAWTRVIPNLAQSYEVSKDASEFTLHLREGLRWSDGVPFTADDIIFWYEADLLNEELHSSIDKDFMVNDTPVVVEKIDSTTVKFSFTGPYGQFATRIAEIENDYVTARPMHYLKKFHPDYNPEGIDALIAEADVEDWIGLWNRKADHRRNSEIPTMNAWILTEDYNFSSTSAETSVVLERNPYYWKIDTEFNQLPYIDRIQFTNYSSTEDRQLAAMNGQIDMQTLGIRESNYDDWAAYKTVGEYDLHTLMNPRANYLSIQLNLVHQDPVLRSVFSNKTFRIALSHAINRTEVIDQVLGLDLEPRQPSPLMASPYYRERLETQYLEYDPTYANELLDAAGYDERDGEGYRLTPEGQRIEFTILVTSSRRLMAAEMLSEYWHELGIIVNTERLKSWPLTQLLRANEHDAVLASVPGGLDVIDHPGIYMPESEYDSYWAIPWVYWYEGNSLGEEPPAPVKAQMRLYDQIKMTIDQDDVVELMDQILTIAEEEFYVMGICGNEEFYMLVRSNFHNVPRTMPKSFSYPTPAPTNPCQYFIDP